MPTVIDSFNEWLSDNYMGGAPSYSEWDHDADTAATPILDSDIESETEYSDMDESDAVHASLVEADEVEIVGAGIAEVEEAVEILQEECSAYASASSTFRERLQHVLQTIIV